MSRKRTPCYMCHRPSRPLTASRDGSIYVNAENVVLFCSVRCAANYGLLWGAPAVFADEHYCTESGGWKQCSKSDCNYCS